VDATYIQFGSGEKSNLRGERRFPSDIWFESYVFYKSFLPCMWIASTIRPRCPIIFDVAVINFKISQGNAAA